MNIYSVFVIFLPRHKTTDHRFGAASGLSWTDLDKIYNYLNFCSVVWTFLNLILMDLAQELHSSLFPLFRSFHNSGYCKLVQQLYNPDSLKLPFAAYCTISCMPGFLWEKTKEFYLHNFSFFLSTNNSPYWKCIFAKKKKNHCNLSQSCSWWESIF